MLSSCRARLEIQLVHLARCEPNARQLCAIFPAHTRLLAREPNCEMKVSFATLIRSSKEDAAKLDNLRVSIDQLHANVQTVVQSCSIQAKFQEQIAELRQKILVVSAQQRILDGLQFNSMEGCYNGVNNSHDNTFCWIYRETDEAPAKQWPR